MAATATDRVAAQLQTVGDDMATELRQSGSHGSRPTTRRGRQARAYTPEVAARIVELVSAGVPIEHAVSAAGVSKATFYRWMQLAESGKAGGKVATHYIDLRDAVEKARSEAVAHNVAIVEAAAPKNWQAAAWWLERVHPEQFARRDGMAVGIHSDVQVRVVVEGDWHGRGAKVVDAQVEPRR